MFLCGSSTPCSVAAACWLLQALTVLWLFIVGGPAVLKMGFGYLFGQQKRVVQGGFDTGVLEYHVIAAKKPIVQSPEGARVED